MPKKTQTKEERRQARLRKGRQWVLTYEGSHIVRDYRKRFNVDNTCAMKNLSEIEALSPEKRAEMQQAERLLILPLSILGPFLMIAIISNLQIERHTSEKSLVCPIATPNLLQKRLG